MELSKKDQNIQSEQVNNSVSLIPKFNLNNNEVSQINSFVSEKHGNSLEEILSVL